MTTTTAPAAGETRSLLIDRYGCGILTVVRVGVAWSARTREYTAGDGVLVRTRDGGEMVVGAADLGPARQLGRATGLPSSAGSMGGDIADERD